MSLQAAELVDILFSQGDAVLIYGGSFSWYDSTNQFSLDNGNSTTVNLNSALPRYQSVPGGPNYRGNMYTSGLIYMQTGLSNIRRNMFVDSNRDNGLLHVNLDYVETIVVTGGSP